MEEKFNKQKVPKATANRLPVYHRCLKTLQESGIERIKSRELSQLTQIPSATIRRDFSHFGELGRSGYGYDVLYVTSVFDQVLNVNKQIKVALVGVGNLGKAMIAYNFKKDQNLNITCSFEKKEESCGKILYGVPVYSLSQMNEVIKREEIQMAISTVPSEYSQEAMDSLVACGVKSILNFAPGRVKVPKDVNIRYIDLTSEILTLVYYNEWLKKEKMNHGLI